MYKIGRNKKNSKLIKSG